MKCPNCKLVNPDTARACDCGWNFEQEGPGPVPEWAEAPQPGRRIRSMLVWTWVAGFLMPAVGAAILSNVESDGRPFWAFLVASLGLCSISLLASRLPGSTKFVLLVLTLFLLAIQFVVIGLICFRISGFEGIL